MTLPIVVTAAVSDVAASSATCGGDVTSYGGSVVSAKGVCWNTTGNPTISDSHTIDGGGMGAFESNMHGLFPNTTYYVRAYATHSTGTSYGSQVSFTSTAQSLPSTVMTAAVSYITATSATCGGNVTSDGGSVVSAKGVCWNTTGNPTISDNHTIDGGGMGSFESNMHGLSTDTTYYVRAYATNSTGTSYGSQVSFTIMEYQTWDGTGLNPNDGLPCQGGAMVTDHVGNVYNTMQIGNQCWMRENLRDASGNEHIFWPDVLQACPTGWHLPDNNDWGILGNYIAFQSSNSLSSLVNFGNGKYWTSTTTLGGSDTLIYYPTAQSNSISFSNYLYPVQYAGNYLSVRCVRDWSGRTDSPTPTVMTAVVSDIATTSVTCSSKVTSDGGSVVSAKGMCWNTTGSPTLSDNHSFAGGGVGTFESTLHGLAVGTTYYVRAYAINSGGISYSNQIMFNFHGGYQTWDGTGLNPNDAFACQGVPTVTDHEGNIYNTVQIGNQCWMRENMRCTTSPSTGTTILEYPADSTSCTGKKAYYVNGSADNTAIYGLLYNWNAAVDTFNTAFGETSINTDRNNSVDVTFSGHRRGICPVGWHVPSSAEWHQLVDYVSSQNAYRCGDVSSNIAKALASTVWGWNFGADSCTMVSDPSTNNATGFSAVPAGSYNYYFGYFEFGDHVNIWSATQVSPSQVLDRWTSSEYSTIYYCNTNGKGNGFSVRCLRD